MVTILKTKSIKIKELIRTIYPVRADLIFKINTLAIVFDLG